MKMEEPSNCSAIKLVATKYRHRSGARWLLEQSFARVADKSSKSAARARKFA
jgi:hypothetical protein